jgi:hypothetical protein
VLVSVFEPLPIVAFTPLAIAAPNTLENDTVPLVELIFATKILGCVTELAKVEVTVKDSVTVIARVAVVKRTDSPVSYVVLFNHDDEVPESLKDGVIKALVEPEKAISISPDCTLKDVVVTAEPEAGGEESPTIVDVIVN